MRGCCNGLVNGLTEGSVPGRIIEHVQVGGGGQKGLLWFYKNFRSLVLVIIFFVYNDPLGVASEWVDSELEDTVGGAGAHGSGGGDKGDKGPRPRRNQPCGCGY
ncbi:hypothetical protein TorRG33x02_112940 [Trema orientale]|uniref:Uncharacterized protein n=1 Tax=Trema orientale TaxID=63057 RepID=A0A2P5F5F3_TREOI|nr:hypothetical protein TorRG33x02_112940 [Trema orientale]